MSRSSKVRLEMGLEGRPVAIQADDGTWVTVGTVSDFLLKMDEETERSYFDWEDPWRWQVRRVFSSKIEVRIPEYDAERVIDALRTINFGSPDFR